MNYYCPDHPGPLDDAEGHVCRLRPGTEPRPLDDGESTSARLRRVEVELADERDKRSQDIAAYERACNVLAAYEVELASVKAELGRRVDKAIADRDRLVAAADKLNDENLALKVELEQLRQKHTTALTERLDALAEVQQLRHQADLGPKAADRQERES